MPVKWNIAVLMFMFGCTMLFAILEEGADPAAYAGTDGVYVLEALSRVTLVSFVNPLNYVGAFFGLGEFSALVDAILFDYAMFETGSWVWVKYLFWTIGFGWFISLIVALGRGVGSGG